VGFDFEEVFVDAFARSVLLGCDFWECDGVGGFVAHYEDATACHATRDDLLGHEHSDSFGSEATEDGNVGVENDISAFVFGFYSEDFLVPHIGEEVNHANGVATGIEEVDKLVG